MLVPTRANADAWIRSDESQMIAKGVAVQTVDMIFRELSFRSMPMYTLPDGVFGTVHV